MFFEYHYPNKEDAILIHIPDQDSDGLLVTYINGFKSKYIISKQEAYRLKNILENKMSKQYNSVQEMLNDTSPEFAKEFKAHMDNPIMRIKKWLMIKWAVIRSKYLENN
jgi:hypothetical protein